MVYEKNGIRMNINSNAESVFIRDGWTLVGDTKAKSVVAEKVTTEEKPVEEKADHKYSKTEINRLSTKDLQDLAKELGIDNAEEISGAKIKPMIIEKLGL